MDEIIAQEILFLMAGYDTTATSITFLLYNLAIHPEIQEKVHEEIENAIVNEVWKIKFRFWQRKHRYQVKFP